MFTIYVKISSQRQHFSFDFEQSLLAIYSIEDILFNGTECAIDCVQLTFYSRHIFVNGSAASKNVARFKSGQKSIVNKVTRFQVSQSLADMVFCLLKVS